MDNDEIELPSFSNEEIFEENYDFESNASLKEKVLLKINALDKRTVAKVSGASLVICVGLVGLCLAFMLSGYAIGYSVGYDSVQDYRYVYHYIGDTPIDRSIAQNEDIVESNEFQLVFHPSYFAEEKRDEEIDNLVAILSEYLDMDVASYKNQYTIYNEIQYDTSNCSTEYEYSEVRTRHYIIGAHDNTTIADVNKDAKGNSKHSREDVLGYDQLYVSDEYLKHSEYKIEQDIHACKWKYNRKAKIKKLPIDFGYETCADILELYPGLFPDIVDTNAAVGLDLDDDDTTVDEEVWVYEKRYKDLSLFYGTTKAVFVWSFYYLNYEDALAGIVAPEEVQWSIRVYSLAEGYGPWAYDLQVDASDLYTYLQANYEPVKDSGMGAPCSYDSIEPDDSD